MNEMQWKMAEQMVSRAVRKGDNETEAREALTRIMRDHTGYNLATALVYEGFATERTALKFAGIEL